MKRTTKLLTLAALITAVITFTGCSKPTDTVPQDNKQDTQKTTEEQPEQVCVHEWDDGVITTEPTCTAAGEKTFTCKLCKETKKEPVEALGHDWVLDEDTATCTTDGKKKYHCSRCPETKEENSPAHHHEDYETSGYCETCKTYKYEVNGDNPEGREITAIIGTSEEYFNTDITKLESDHWSFPIEKEDDYISLEEILHMKSKYKDCKVKCWQNSMVSFEKSLTRKSKSIDFWAEECIYVIIE